MSALGTLFKEKLYDPLFYLLKRGTSPKKLAWSVALGMVFGIMPAIGIVTALSTFVALRFRLNVALLVGVSYLMSPLYLLLYIPFIRAGLYFFENDFDLTFGELRAMFQEDWWMALQEIWFANLMGLAVWAVAALPLAGGAYLIAHPIISKLAKKKEKK